MEFARRWNESVQRILFRWAVRLSPERSGAIPDQIIFIHVPKTAGTSAHRHLKMYLGSSRSGNTVSVNSNLFLARAPQHEHREKTNAARTARFVSGHFSWKAYEELKREEGSFAFTFLREPNERLRSLYNYVCCADLKTKQPEYNAARGMSPEEFFGSERDWLRHARDNYVTRQFSGDFDVDLTRESVALEAVERAISNLETLQFVGLVDHYDEDYVSLMTALGLPIPHRVPHHNRSPNTTQTKNETISFSEEVDELIEAYSRYDRIIFEHFVTQRDGVRDACNPTRKALSS